jgi:hypothetical protein
LMLVICVAATPAPPKLVMTTSALPDGVIGRPYAARLRGNGGNDSAARADNEPLPCAQQNWR